jgi:tetratricopeptide (TPR) repeat protein
MHLFFILLFSFSLYSQDANLTYEKALEQYKAKDYIKSIETIRELILANGTKYEYHYLAAHDYWSMLNHKVAISHLQSAIKFKPEDPNAYIDLVKVLADSKSLKAALNLCEESLEKFKENKELRILQASLLIRFAKYELALPIIENLKNSSPTDFRPISLEGQLFFQKREYDKAEMSLKWAESLNKTEPSILNNLALVHEQMAILSLNKSKTVDAKKFIDQALEEIETASKIMNTPSINDSKKRIYELSKKIK